MIIVDVINGAIYAENEADPRCRQQFLLPFGGSP